MLVCGIVRRWELLGLWSRVVGGARCGVGPMRE